MANPNHSECEESWKDPTGKEERDYFRRIRSRRISIGELLTSAAVLLILSVTLLAGEPAPITSTDITGSISTIEPMPVSDMCDEDGYRSHPC